MDNNDLKKALLQAFSEEAPDILQKIESALLDLEVAESSDEAQYIDQLKRGLHSLKGSSSAVGRSDIRNVCHAVEELLLESCEEVSIAVKLDRIHSSMVFLREAIANPATLAEKKSEAVLAIITGIAPAEKNLSDAIIAEESIAVPALELETTVLSPPPMAQPNMIVMDSIRVSVDKIEDIQSCAGELVAIRLQQEDEMNKLGFIQRDMELLQGDWQQIKSLLQECRQILPRDVVTKLDVRMAMFNSKIKTTHRDVFHLSNRARNQTGNLGLLSDQFDMGLRAIRMMPLGPFFESYRASARDAARQLNKLVQVECSDKGVEVDRLVLEKIKEPILHLIRNSVGHGIETPEQRKMLGKNETGLIKLSAELNGDYVCIQIKDDGAGFDKDKISQKAIQSGLLNSDDILNDDRLLELISRPGFSTATQADMVSGRGIGMDVVFTMLTEMGGKIELETQEGFGSCFTLQVPSSLAKTQGLILQVGQKCFGLALDTVDRIVRMPLASLSTVETKQVLYIDDEPIAVSSLAAILNLTQSEPRHAKASYPIVIVRSVNKRIALIVDDIPGEIPLVIKSLGPQFESISLYSGGAILSDGAVLPIVNARHLVAAVSTHSVLRMDAVLDEGVDDELIVAPQERGIIIVVDDSITTRTLERNILEAAGYNVAVATDGIEALDLLLMEDNVSLLITDLEMPRMDGLELCKTIRSGRNADLPIIMVTSLGNDTEKKKGLEAGADAYIVKSDFQQDYFLEMVERFAR